MDKTVATLGAKLNREIAREYDNQSTCLKKKYIKEK